MDAGTTNPVITGITIGGSADHWVSGQAATNNADTNAAIWYDKNCAGGSTAIAITMGSGSGTGPVTSFYCLEFSGVDTVSPLDKTGTGTLNGNAASWSSGSSGTLSQANEVGIGCVNSASTTTLTTPGSPWNELAQVNTNPKFAVGYQVVSATTALTYNGTIGAATTYGVCLITLKAATAVKSGALLSIFP